MTAFFCGVLFTVVAMLAIVWLYEQPQQPRSTPVPPRPRAEPQRDSSQAFLVWQMAVPASGVEVFTPPLLAGRVYQLTFTGTYSYVHEIVDWTQIKRRADAIFYTDELGNFKLRYAGVEVNGVAAGSGQLDSWREYRGQHRYTCLIEGDGEQACIRLQYPEGPKRSSSNSITLHIELLPPETPSVRLRQEQRAKERAEAEAAERLREAQEQQRQARLAEEERRRQEQAAEAERLRQQSERQKAEAEAEQRQLIETRQRAIRLSLTIQSQPNFLDPAFCRQFARKYRTEVLSSLKQSWTDEYIDFRADTELVRTAAEVDPRIAQYYERRVEMIAYAERLEVKPESPPKAVRPPKPLPITARTKPEVEQLVSDLFTLRTRYDQVKRLNARATEGALVPRGPVPNEAEQIAGEMAYLYSLLRRYGIAAKSPEEAEAQLRQLCPVEPVRTPYQLLQERILSGEHLSLDIVLERIKDLWSEECTLVSHRKRAVRGKQWQEQQALEQRLAAARAERAYWMEFTTSKGQPVELRKEPEESFEEGVVRQTEEKLRLIEYFRSKGDEQGAEQVKAIYAEKIAELFKPTVQQYT